MTKHMRLRRGLQAAFTSMLPVTRGTLLGARCSWAGLVRATMHQGLPVYELKLAK
jgi:hypothetical protein